MLKIAYGVNSHFDNLLRQAEPAAHYFIKELGLEQMKLTLMIDPVLSTYAAGACGETLGGDICVMISPLANLMEDIVAVVAHELVHCQQIHRGDLRTDIATRTIYWKGEAYPVQPNQPNRECPWEVEAYEAMYPMAEMYRKQANVHDGADHLWKLMRELLR